MFEAMVYILRVGRPWRDLPPSSALGIRFLRDGGEWCQAGLWEKLPALEAREAKGKLHFLDASHVKKHQDASNPSGSQQNQAIGRTKGGLNTKITAWVDRCGRAMSLSLAPGQHADVTSHNRRSGPSCAAQSPWPTKVTTAVGFGHSCGNGKTAHVFRRAATNRLKPVSWHRGHYRKRRKAENLFQRLKRYRRIGTRYEKNDVYFLGFVQLAAVFDWLKN